MSFWLITPAIVALLAVALFVVLRVVPVLCGWRRGCFCRCLIF